MEGQEHRSDQELAAAGDTRAQLRVRAAAWIESKGITDCPVCKQKDAWDIAGASHVYPLSFNAMTGWGGSRTRNMTAERVLSTLSRKFQGSMGSTRLLKLVCINCRYALLLDAAKMAEDLADDGDDTPGL